MNARSDSPAGFAPDRPHSRQWSRTSGYFVSVVIDVILLYVAQHLLDWNLPCSACTSAGTSRKRWTSTCERSFADFVTPLRNFRIGALKATWQVDLDIVHHVQDSSNPMGSFLSCNTLGVAAYSPRQRHNTIVDLHPDVSFLDAGVPLELTEHVQLNPPVGLDYF
jgi:hypothetical protein